MTYDQRVELQGVGDWSIRSASGPCAQAVIDWGRVFEHQALNVGVVRKLFVQAMASPLHRSYCPLYMEFEVEWAIAVVE